MKIIAIVQARQDSIRFPSKVLQKINNKSLIEILLKRLSRSKLLDSIIVATSKKNKNIELCNLINDLGFKVFNGSENDVLKRYYDASKKYQADIIVRITADCPLIDPILLDEMIKLFLKNDYDYISNTIKPTFPDGMDIEIMTFQAIKKAHKNSKKQFDREHVTPFIKQNKDFKKFNFLNKNDLSHFRLTVDYPEDLVLVKKLIKEFKKSILFSWKEIEKILISKKDSFNFNNNFVRDEGSTMSTGQKMWKRAKKIIPGGTMLFSKNPDNFLPKQWPAYFSKAHESFIWDLDNNKFIDMSYMGVGTNILGYSNKKVDNEVIKYLRRGNMSTLNSKEEILLAEKLVDLHPWSQMVRFARSGGEANAIAIRIARAASGKDNIAVCGYHGWHDWYLSSNINDKNNLSQHLMKDLEVKGVPKHLKNTTFTFEYNNFDQLKKIVNKHNIGVIKMEVSRNYAPKKNFLENVRKLATKKNIVLIFDECTSGFRRNFGGLHKFYNVEPDMAMFGKAMGNGYAVTAVIGKQEIMNAAQKTFISSTFWTERSGSVAALKTLELMESLKSWEIVTKKGLCIKKNWRKIADKNKVKINILGLDAMPSFLFLGDNSNLCKSILTQEMLKKNILATNSVYLSVTHSDKILDRYFNELDKIFDLIGKNQKNKDFHKLLEGPPAQLGFKRLN